MTSFASLLVSRLAAPRELFDAPPKWRDLARPEQIPPPGDWLTFFACAGRGWGKTRAAAEWAAEQARFYRGCRIALVAATFADGRDTMVEGDSGMLSVLDDTELRGGGRDTAWNRSLGELFLANNSRFKIYSSERPRQLRGPQHHFAWGDEAAQWLDARKGTAQDTTWSNLLFGLRLPARPGWPPGYQPRVFVATTPRFVPLLKVPDGVLRREPHRAGILQRDDTVVVRRPTSDNLANLDDTYKRNVIAPLEGTTLGRQELDAEILEDVDGAFVTRRLIDRDRKSVGEIPVLIGCVTAVDPAITEGEDSDETGVVTVGADAAGHGYVLGDRSLKASPDVWGRVVWDAVFEHQAQAVVVEDNQGGDMVVHVLSTAWDIAVRERTRRGIPTPPPPPVVRVHPSGRGQGKWVRAQAVRALYEQHRVHHVDDPTLAGTDLAELEDQLSSWTGEEGEDSPDRVDAEVHGLNWLLFPGQRSGKDRGGQAGGQRYESRTGRR